MIEAYAIVSQVIDQTQQALKSGNKGATSRIWLPMWQINTNRFEKRRVVSEAIKITRTLYTTPNLFSRKPVDM